MTINVVPSVVELPTETLPLLSSTNSFTKSKPIPAPLAEEVPIRISLFNLKSCEIFSGGIPTPESLIFISKNLLFILDEEISIRPPIGVNLIALEIRFRNTI